MKEEKEVPVSVLYARGADVLRAGKMEDEGGSKLMWRGSECRKAERGGRREDSVRERGVGDDAPGCVADTVFFCLCVWLFGKGLDGASKGDGGKEVQGGGRGSPRLCGEVARTGPGLEGKHSLFRLSDGENCSSS